ncbi:unnamed protein product [Mytilus coruscus]|uniref:Cysteine and tyrosine-rich protein 1 n=1 Tax=Mytilus coruscus TaxID=42192 RepID=A0A6J8DVF0_MYTCO|nr:unnamed protein product [Mytilus coruscus]
MTNIYVLFYFILYNVIPTSGRYCYSRYYYYYRYGYYNYCNSYLSVGTITGAVIGGIIGLVIIIAIVVVICAFCCKSHGGRGTVVQPFQTASTVHTVTTIPAYHHPPPQYNNMHYSQYPPNVYSSQQPNTSMAYPPPIRQHIPSAPPTYPSTVNNTNMKNNPVGSFQRQQNMPAIPENVPVESPAPVKNVSPTNGAIITGPPPTGTNLHSTSGILHSDPPPYPGTVSRDA